MIDLITKRIAWCEHVIQKSAKNNDCEARENGTQRALHDYVNGLAK